MTRRPQIPLGIEARQPAEFPSPRPSRLMWTQYDRGNFSYGRKIVREC